MFIRWSLWFVLRVRRLRLGGFFFIRFWLSFARLASLCLGTGCPRIRSFLCYLRMYLCGQGCHRIFGRTGDRGRVYRWWCRLTRWRIFTIMDDQPKLQGIDRVWSFILDFVFWKGSIWCCWCLWDWSEGPWSFQGRGYPFDFVREVEGQVRSTWKRWSTSLLEVDFWVWDCWMKRWLLKADIDESVFILPPLALGLAGDDNMFVLFIAEAGIYFFDFP